MTEDTIFNALMEYPLRSGVTVAAASRGSGIKMLNMGELFKFPRIPNVEMARVNLTGIDENRTLLRRHDLVFARRSLTLEGAGKCSIVEEVDEPTTWESSIIRARLDPAIADARFYFYYFNSPVGRQQMEKIVQQVAAAGIRLSELGKLVVPSPELKLQRSIAEVLGAFDDKIAANSKLGVIADEWVRARFDNVSRESVETRNVAELVSMRRDQVGPASLTGDIPYVGLEHVPRRSMWLGDVGSAADVTSHKNRFEYGDLLFGKLRPYFHKVATAPHGGVCSTDILVLTPIDPTLRGISLAAVASDSVVREVNSVSQGTRMPRTSWRDLGAVEVPWPGIAAARVLSSEISTVREVVEAQVRENRSLAATRDTLLPQLMSGKLRVRDAEKILEGVL